MGAAEVIDRSLMLKRGGGSRRINNHAANWVNGSVVWFAGLRRRWLADLNQVHGDIVWVLAAVLVGGFNHCAQHLSFFSKYQDLTEGDEEEKQLGWT
jgi:hypothetical protein